MRHPDLALPTSDLLAWAAGAREAAEPTGCGDKEARSPNASGSRAFLPLVATTELMSQKRTPCCVCCRGWGCLSQQCAHVSTLAVDIALYEGSTGGNWVKKTRDLLLVLTCEYTIISRSFLKTTKDYMVNMEKYEQNYGRQFLPPPPFLENKSKVALGTEDRP